MGFDRRLEVRTLDSVVGKFRLPRLGLARLDRDGCAVDDLDGLYGGDYWECYSDGDADG
jgi:hypothetical protein